MPRPRGRDRICDNVAACDPVGNGPRQTYVIEFQTRNDPQIDTRLLEYVVLVLCDLRTREPNAEVLGAVVNLTGSQQTIQIHFATPNRPDAGLAFSGPCRALRDEDAGGTLAAIEAGETTRAVLGFVPLMRGGGESITIERWLVLAGADPDARMRADHGALARAFAQLTPGSGEWERALEDWDMELSPWLEEMARLQVVQNQRRNLLRVLEVRFDTPLPSAVVDAVNATEDLSELTQWFEEALVRPTLAAWLRATQPQAAAVGE